MPPSRVTDMLCRVCAPPGGARVIYDLLARTSRLHFHGMRDHTLAFFGAVALITPWFLPTASFSFFIWYAIFHAYLTQPAGAFVREIRHRHRAVDLLTTPLTSAEMASGFSAFFRLTCLFAAVPYCLYWMAFLALRPGRLAGWYHTATTADILLFAVFLYAAVSAVLWFLLWTHLVHPALDLLPVGLVVIAATRDRFDEYYIFLTRLPRLGVRDLAYVAVAALAGFVLHAVSRRHMTSILRRRLFP